MKYRKLDNLIMGNISNDDATHDLVYICLAPECTDRVSEKADAAAVLHISGNIAGHLFHTGNTEIRQF